MQIPASEPVENFLDQRFEALQEEAEDVAYQCELKAKEQWRREIDESNERARQAKRKARTRSETPGEHCGCPDCRARRTGIPKQSRAK